MQQPHTSLRESSTSPGLHLDLMFSSEMPLIFFFFRSIILVKRVSLSYQEAISVFS